MIRPPSPPDRRQHQCQQRVAPRNLFARTLFTPPPGDPANPKDRLTTLVVPVEASGDPILDVAVETLFKSPRLPGFWILVFLFFVELCSPSSILHSILFSALIPLRLSARFLLAFVYVSKIPTSGPHIFDDANRAPARTSVFRAIMSSKAHKRNQSADDAMPPPSVNKQSGPGPFPWTEQAAPSSGHLPLGEIVPNRDAGDNMPGQRPNNKESKGALHKKTKSAVSLKSLRSYMERKDNKSDERSIVDSEEMKPKKAKSSNSLSAILKRSQRGRKDGAKQSRDKENRSPTDLVDNMPSPLWPQENPLYQAPSSRSRQNSTADRRRSVAEEVSLYTPKGYSPAQQRNFYDYHQPSLTRTGEAKPRPKSECLAGNRKMRDVMGSLQRAPTGDNVSIDSASSKGTGLTRARKTSPSESPAPPAKDQANPKRLSRVQAAISAFNAKERDAEVHQHLNSKDLESEFEKLLDARNIPHNMRDKMRSLDTNIKADFIQKDRFENGTPHSAGAPDSRRGRGKESKDSQDRKGSRSRSRSRGFTFGRGSSSPGKKARPDSGTFSRPRSVDLSQPVGVYTTLSAAGSTASLSEAAAVDTAADPSDFVHYLREIQKPEMIEVGKLHKLRLLLRNETVSWVDGFIAEGGMDEIVQLIYRIMKMEWREDHEDTLLHEALLCLKALCTTSIALAHLTSIEAELFPALLKMLFDEEKKGPSEFTTRGIIINLLFTQLSAVSPNELPSKRAMRILSYLRDPSPEADNQPVSFIANIYQSRPYRVWCKEVTNVTKEVFWIFLHHLNVIPTPKADPKSDDPFTESRRLEAGPYYQRHFPPPRPPVPAAPYVGGVEWDATNYLAVHLDLLNGLIASLPTTDERNQLRSELRASGFEKVMGGSLRTCKEKFYSSVHDCLRTWVAAAVEDGWPYLLVREGPPRAGEPGSPTKSPKKSAPGSPKKGLLDEKPPKLDLALDFSDSRPAASGPLTPSSDLRSWL
ncbi:Diaphanous GTPase-binding [Penicillium macrosclerotiorum]|uniref:Diaphanous GTPase-binding n=1 Tax=Penicillium macrosclerotiorum TaxID=303699 RepID=UPI002549AE93|nr:Diaphanous GTPase-binding [Penicillium macrosclerotiorum]KAJ5679278.1 Diaphanous GTPase-binding [Penicillium macrosclerotiorum]